MIMCWSLYAFFAWSGPTALLGEYITGAVMQRAFVAVQSSLKHIYLIPFKFYYISGSNRGSNHGSNEELALIHYATEVYSEFLLKFSQFWAVYKHS